MSEADANANSGHAPDLPVLMEDSVSPPASLVSSAPEQAFLTNDDKNALASISVTTNMLVASYSFEAFEANQLSVNIRDVVTVLDRNANGPEWWKVQRTRDDAIGIVPSNYFVSTIPFTSCACLIGNDIDPL